MGNQLWECESCGFAMSATHKNDDGSGYDCPECELSELRKQLEFVQYERDQYRKWRDDLQHKVESVQRERDTLNQERYTWRSNDEHARKLTLENIALQRDKAALIEVLERIADVHLDRESDGEARTILTQMKGETP